MSDIIVFFVPTAKVIFSHFIKFFIVRNATAFEIKTTLEDCPKSTTNDFIVVLHDFFSPGSLLKESNLKIKFMSINFKKPKRIHAYKSLKLLNIILYC
jgi:hypothetical protein